MTSSVLASPVQQNSNNPNIVAFYTSGTHGVVGESSTHIGTDTVMAAGNSGNFQQWFVGTSDSSPDADHSV